MSKGRVVLGVGLGWQIEEFESVGVPYNERGRRMDEMIPALRALWTDSPASYEGKYYKFTKVDCDVKPVQKGGPQIMIGGSSTPAAERAAKLGDAYYPYAISPDEYAALIATMRAKAKEIGRNPDDIELTAAPAFWREGDGKSLDLGLARAYAQSGVKRLLFNSMEADSQDMKDIERFIKTYRDQIIERL
jgi:alkanesulfonate monooxygenase SsuD/methylene tetrahydromethanopterin reductase-like flavin-dependent oxidoreductase (luciferase family)